MRLQDKLKAERDILKKRDDGDRQVANVPLNLLDRQFVVVQPNQKWIAYASDEPPNDPHFRSL